jgi:putative hemolysin
LRSCAVIFSILGAVFATDVYASPLASFIGKLFGSMTESACHGLAIVLILIVLGFFTILLGIIVPSKLALKKANKIAASLYPIIITARVIFLPIIGFITLLSNGIVRLFGVDPHAKEEVTEEEIKMMVDAGTESGSIDAEEQEIIKNVFEFDDLTAGEVATHRTDMSLLWLDSEVEEWDRIIRDSRFSRFPVCDETVDKVVGILNARVYFTLEDKSKENILANAVKPAYFVPETAKADLLFKNMKQKREFLAVVLDEYGGTLGIVTLNDLVECLIGEFNIDEEQTEEVEENITAIADRTYAIKGSSLISEVEEALSIEISDIDSETFSGFIMELNGAIPDDGSVFEIETDTLSIKVLEVKDHVIEKAEVFVKPEKSDEDSEDEKAESKDEAQSEEAEV